MTYVLADNIYSPLGQTTEANLQAILEGRTILHCHKDERGLLAPYTASLFDEHLSFEEMILRSARQAMSQASIDLERTVLIVSTTKGEIGTPLGKSAVRIARALGIPSMPITVCNACISGLSAIILAKSLIEMGYYESAVVCGADVQSEFIISGFQSLKALSPNECRPFDMERTGLNLGEAAATVILGRKPRSGDAWCIERGSIHNDAYHISTPSKTAEGLYRCLQDVLPEHRDFVLNLHGTATMFNDQMESVAIRRAELEDLPANGLKGYYGHTMGAAGILETVLTMHALDQHIIIGTRGFEELGVSGQINLSAGHRKTEAQTFVKCLAGFGGGNAAIRARKMNVQETKEGKSEAKKNVWQTIGRVSITPQKIMENGRCSALTISDEGGLTALYKSLAVDYPKFYKMDMLCRLGFLATEILLKDKALEENTTIILFNRSSSEVSDKKYIATISDEKAYYPSPSVFVYTLPNIVLGEIALRHGLHGETSFYVLPGREEETMSQIIASAQADTLITGWLDCEDDRHFEADLSLLTLKQQGQQG